MSAIDLDRGAAFATGLETGVAGFLPVRVVQLHVSNFCNLSCSHCYSSSSPSVRDNIDVAVALRALETLHGEGFDVLSLSGGEPFLYPDLVTLVHGSAAIGFQVNLVSNGMRFDLEILESIARSISTVAVSFDGISATHDRLRGRKGAFEKAREGLAQLRTAGIRFGIITCATKDTLPEIPDLFELAVAEEASLFQIRPLAQLGRGRNLAANALDEYDIDRLVVLANVLSGIDERVRVQCDLAATQMLLAGVAVRHATLIAGTGAARLADQVNPWVIDERGDSQPFAYGTARAAILPTLAALADGHRNLDEEARAHCLRVVESTRSALAETNARFADWYGWLTDTPGTDGLHDSGPDASGGGESFAYAQPIRFVD